MQGNSTFTTDVSINSSGNMNPSRPNLPIGRQTFEVLRNAQDVYVDKTQLIYQLITQGSVYFLSRPRRFGKSLLLTTLKSLFEGRKDLFEGLWVAEKTDYAFDNYPVLLLDLSLGGAENADSLKTKLINQLNMVAKQLGISLEVEAFDQRFAELIQQLKQKTGQPVVVLIDEYDKPILDNIGKPELGEIRDTLRQFYTILKASDAHLKFVFLTGISKFSKVSVFSGLNNLTDISMASQYATLCGYTQDELETHFPLWVDDLAAACGLERDTVLEKIKLWYNGYRFCEVNQLVYNPFSTLLLFQHKKFKAHWFESGTPSMLIQVLTQQNYPLHNLEHLSSTEEEFSVFDVENMQVAPLFFQTGYLTIKDHDPEFGTYTLGFPNREVKSAFLSHLLKTFDRDRRYSGSIIQELTQAVRAGKVEVFMQVLQSFFASIPYDIQRNQETREKEHYYQSLFYVIFALVGIHTRVEERTHQGRIDAVIETEQAVYLFEFKMTAWTEHSDNAKAVCQQALQQIRDHEYPTRFNSPTQNKTLQLIGVAFDFDKRGIAAWEIETL